MSNENTKQEIAQNQETKTNQVATINNDQNKGEGQMSKETINPMDNVTAISETQTTKDGEIMTNGIQMNKDKFDALKFHPTANISLNMSENEYDSLIRDIAENGLQESITLFKGKIIDGRQRFKACKTLVDTGKLSLDKVSFENMPEGIEPVSFILSKNMHRRHYNESQRAMVAARMIPLFAEQASENQKSGHKVDANTQQGRCNDQVAALVNIGSRSVGSAKTIIDSGCKELIELVEAGIMRVSAAESLWKAFGKDSSKVTEAIKHAEDEVKQEVHAKQDKELTSIRHKIAEYQSDIAGATPDKKGAIEKKLQCQKDKEQDIISGFKKLLNESRYKNIPNKLKSLGSAANEYSITLVVELRDGKFTPDFKALPSSIAKYQGIIIQDFSSKNGADEYLENNTEMFHSILTELLESSKSLNETISQHCSSVQTETSKESVESEESAEESRSLEKAG